MPLLDHEMLFVTGKGGTGKTTVAAALALASARSGRRTIVCEFAEQARIPRLLGTEGAAPGEEVQAAPNLWTTTITSWRVLEEWVARILGSRSLTNLLVRSNFFRAFAEAAPGGMELGEIVKTWELAQDRRWNKRHGRYDLVVVDGPASGHALGMLGTPSTFSDIARVGPIASQSRRVREWLADARRTAYVGVALPGELPVAETVFLEERLEASLGRRLEAVVVNAVLPDRFTASELDALDAAAPGSELASLVRAADRRAGLEAAHVERLRGLVGAPVTELPFVFAPELGREQIEALAERLQLT